MLLLVQSDCIVVAIGSKRFSFSALIYCPTVRVEKVVGHLSCLQSSLGIIVLLLRVSSNANAPVGMSAQRR